MRHYDDWAFAEELAMMFGQGAVSTPQAGTSLGHEEALNGAIRQQLEGAVRSFDPSRLTDDELDELQILLDKISCPRP
jgi:hypothetical protein